MKRLLQCLCILTAALLLFTGCSTTTIERTETDGTAFKASNRRTLWKSNGVDIQYQRDAAGVKAGARLDHSGSDAESLRAIAEGAAAGAARGAKSIVP